jgi:large subunit ribosomal protein L23
MVGITQIVKRPIITEKATGLSAQKFYTFEVDREATKPQIKKAVEEIFGVHVVKVRTINVKGKTRRVGRKRYKTKLASWKKAIIELKEGEKIDIFEV